MYEMATGKVQFDGDNPVSVALQHVREQPAPPRSLNPNLPENLEAVILRSLHKLPTERYTTAEAMLDDLGRVQASEPIAVAAALAEGATRAVGPAGAAAAQATQVRPPTNRVRRPSRPSRSTRASPGGAPSGRGRW